MVGRGSSGVSNSFVRVRACVRLCLRACVSMEVEGQPQVLVLHHLLSCETRSLIGLELYHGGQASLSERSGICFSLSPVTGDSSAQH